MRQERDEKFRAELDRRERERIAQAAFGWQEIQDRREFEQTLERFFSHFFPEGERRVPSPYVTWDVSHSTSSGHLPERQASIDDLHRKALSAMKAASPISQWLVVENINHPWFRVDLHSTPDHIEHWPVELLPWADPCYVVAHDFSCGFLADTDHTISAFGRPLLDAIHLDVPSVFAHVVESDFPHDRIGKRQTH